MTQHFKDMLKVRYGINIADDEIVKIMHDINKGRYKEVDVKSLITGKPFIFNKNKKAFLVKINNKEIPVLWTKSRNNKCQLITAFGEG